MGIHKKPININLPGGEENLNEITYQLFCCVKCGIHAKAFTVSVAKGNDSQTYIELLDVLPGKISIIDTFGELPCGSEIIETIFCGRCGSPGVWDFVPEFVLKDMGVKIYQKEMACSSDCTSDSSDSDINLDDVIRVLEEEDSGRADEEKQKIITKNC